MRSAIAGEGSDHLHVMRVLGVHPCCRRGRRHEHEAGQAEVVPWLHLVLHAVGLSHGGPLPARLH